MKVFQIIFETHVTEISVGEEEPKIRTGSEIEEETVYWSGPDLQVVTTAAASHAYQYEKNLIAVRDVLTVTNHIKLVDDANNLQILEAARMAKDD